MNSSRRRVGGKILVLLTLGLAVASAISATDAKAIGPILETIHVVKRVGSACYTILTEVGDGLDAVPFTRRIIDKIAAKNWRDHFNLERYHEAKEKYLEAFKSDDLQLEKWGLPETRLAYISALIERATDMPVSLADSFIDDPIHARALQLLCKGTDLGKPLTAWQVENFMNRAFLLTGKLDITKALFEPANVKKLHEMMKENLWKDSAVHGVIDLYTKFNLRVYTKTEIKEITTKEIRDLASDEVKTLETNSARAFTEAERTKFIDDAFAKKMKIDYPPLLEERMKSAQLEGKKAFWTRLFKSPRAKVAMALLTWNPVTIVHKLRPGLLPEWDFIKNRGPEVVKDCLERGWHRCLEPLEPAMRKEFKQQYYYDWTRKKIAWWAGVFTVGYAIGELYGLDPEQVQDWILDQGRAGADAIDKAFFENDDKLPAIMGVPPFVF